MKENYNSSRYGGSMNSASKASFEGSVSNSIGNYSTNDQSATGKKNKKSMTSKLFKGMSNKLNKYL